MDEQLPLRSNRSSITITTMIHDFCITIFRPLMMSLTLSLSLSLSIIWLMMPRGQGVIGRHSRDIVIIFYCFGFGPNKYSKVIFYQCSSHTLFIICNNFVAAQVIEHRTSNLALVQIPLEGGLFYFISYFILWNEQGTKVLWTPGGNEIGWCP